MSESVQRQGVSIGCYVGLAAPEGLSRQRVQFTIQGGVVTELPGTVYETLALDDAEDLLKEALKMIRARRRRLRR